MRSASGPQVGLRATVGPWLPWPGALQALTAGAPGSIDAQSTKSLPVARTMRTSAMRAVMGGGVDPDHASCSTRAHEMTPCWAAWLRITARASSRSISSPVPLSAPCGVQGAWVAAAAQVRSSSTDWLCPPACGRLLGGGLRGAHKPIPPLLLFSQAPRAGCALAHLAPAGCYGAQVSSGGQAFQDDSVGTPYEPASCGAIGAAERQLGPTVVQGMGACCTASAGRLGQDAKSEAWGELRNRPIPFACKTSWSSSSTFAGSQVSAQAVCAPLRDVVSRHSVASWRESVSGKRQLCGQGARTAARARAICD